MTTTEQIKALREKQEILCDKRQSIEDTDYFTRAMQRECDKLRHAELRLMDAADRLECGIWMQDADFALAIVHNIKPMPAGPVEIGEATIWYNGIEYGCTDIWHYREFGRPMRNGGIND